MNIRSKISLIVLPLIITPLVFTALVAYLSARNGITIIATEFLNFKMEELKKYAGNQWQLLIENKLDTNARFVDITKDAIESFAKSLIRSPTELIIAIDGQGNTALQTAAVTLSSGEKEQLLKLKAGKSEGWQQITLANQTRVCQTFLFAPFDWYVLITEARDTFYLAIYQIVWQTGIILLLALSVSVLSLFIFSKYLTSPIRHLALTMKDIIMTNDLSKRVDVLYADETGNLGHTFNLMTEELEKAYNEIKKYALTAAVAQNKEQKIRNIFQKYVPKDVIEQYFSAPEKMLVGEERMIAILFSDIRGFTSISERMLPREVVESLNTYFSRMVEIVMRHQGIVDKYIGDCIMAFYGAPVQHEDDADAAVLSALEMTAALTEFNNWQAEHQRPQFKIGIGINYGNVTVGNIGSEKKMDYTIIGDMVNLASRIEGLTKYYRENLLISEYVYQNLRHDLPCRLVDRVVVKGKTQSVRIYSVKSELSPAEVQAWPLYQLALDNYYTRNFQQALAGFTEVQRLLPTDHVSQLFKERCSVCLTNPPPADWDGIVSLESK